MARARTFFAAAAATTGALALDNGFKLPAMGWSSWNACSSFRDNGPNGWCWNTEDYIHNVTKYMVSSGLAALGYDHVNVDEGWLKSRSPDGHMVEDFDKFPSGMRALGDFIRGTETFPGSGRRMQYGLYTCRGSQQCGTGTYGAVGSLGYEAVDVAWMVDAGASYIKVDSCSASQNHSVAFAEYALFRDAMNASGTAAGRRVWFSLCGWEEWYALPDPALGYAGGGSLGNSWRIAGDGSGWGPLTNCMNVVAAVSNATGVGAFNDPDLLIGPQVYVGGQTDSQARAQFSMWALFPTNLIISQNVLGWSDYALETYSNAEVIAIDQDPLVSPARRLVGGDLTYPCGAGACAASTVAAVTAEPCVPGGSPAQAWAVDAAAGHVSHAAFPGALLDAAGCGNADGAPVALTPAGAACDGACGGRSQVWTLPAGGRPGALANTGSPGRVLDVYDWTGPAVDIWTANGGTNQNFTFDAVTGQLRTAPGGGGPPGGMCLAARAAPPAGAACTNVWGRQLYGGAFALGMVNNAPAPASVACDAACFDALGVPPGVAALEVRDVWAHATVARLARPFAFAATVAGDGAANLYRLTPVA